MTEVQAVHEAWSSNMKDARPHQRDSDQKYDPAYRSPSTSQHRSSVSHSRHTSSASRSSTTPSQTPSRSGPTQPAASAVDSRPSHLPEEPSSPKLAPIAPAESAQAHTSRSLDPALQAHPSTVPELPRQHAASPQMIVVRDLDHIQSFASTEASSESGGDVNMPPQYIISEMSIDHIIEMVAGLLTKITTTNDEHYEHLHRSAPPPDATPCLSSQTNSVLAFHGKNVPSITILQYLARIQKYCPATYEVFLSLLVYFDRMTERVNSGQMISLRQMDQESQERAKSHDGQNDGMRRADNDMSPASSEGRSPQESRAQQAQVQQGLPSPPLSDSDPTNLSSFFVVDSFNIHRLVIAGVTCAAKFFSDVFFTNSRYAKVGGLPLAELNHLELQFLLLNDFRLAITVEELDSYATMLVEFYAREVVAQRQADSMEGR